MNWVYATTYVENIFGMRKIQFQQSEGLFRRFQKEWDQLDQEVNDLMLFEAVLQRRRP